MAFHPFRNSVIAMSAKPIMIKKVWYVGSPASSYTARKMSFCWIISG